MKRGQSSGSGAATLILIILLLIIFYILFLPQDTREDLLGKEGGYYSSDGDSTSSETSKRLPKDVLLEEKDLSMTPLNTLYDKQIPNVYLFEIINAKELENFNPFTIKNGWFDTEFKNYTFVIDDLEKTENVMMSFRIIEARGKLTIRLNGYIIYDYTANKGDIDPIRIEKAYLNDINRLDFSVDGVGMKFWKTNEFKVERAKITADITDVVKQKSSNVFTLTDTEYENLESVKLNFIPECKTGEVGQLDILINNREIFSAIPECNDIYMQPVPVGILDEGENFVIFRTTRGSYKITNIKAEIDYKENERWRFHFDVEEDDYEDIEDGDKDVKLKIRFDDDDDNRADFIINGHRDDFDEDDTYFEQDISRWIDEGSNTITIEPKTDFDIDSIRIEIED